MTSLPLYDQQAPTLDDKATLSAYINSSMSVCFTSTNDNYAHATLTHLSPVNAKDVEYPAEVAAWHGVAGDGIDAEGF